MVSVRIEDLAKAVMGGLGLGLSKERLVPFEAARHITDADDRPGAFHKISAIRFRAGSFDLRAHSYRNEASWLFSIDDRSPVLSHLYARPLQ